MSPEEQYRLHLIRDSLIGVTYHLHPEVILYPFLDNLSLLHQAPLVYAFWEGDRCVYSSLKDPDFLARHEVVLQNPLSSGVAIRKTGYRLSVHRFPPRRTPSGERIVLPLDSNATSFSQALLTEADRFALPDEFFASLGTSIESHELRRTEGPPLTRNPPHIQMPYDDVKALLAPMRGALDSVFADSFRSDRLKLRKGSLTYPNIFAVVRTCPLSSRRYNGCFDYTAGLLLLSEMKTALRRWCATACMTELTDHPGNCPLESSDPEECLTALEYPLGPNSRSVSDLVFSSGLVDFGRQPSEEQWDASVAGDPLDERRRTIEQCVYPPGWRLFYIPVHVGGAPWLALFTFTRQDPASDHAAWHHNYSFYRDLAQKAAALIRQEAHDAYAELLAKRLVTHMKSWVTPLTTIISRVNEDAQRLAQVYPFPRAFITEGQRSQNDIFVPGRGVIALTFAPNTFFLRQVSWNIGDEESILRRCREAIGDFTKIEQSIEINAVAQSSHLLKVPLRVLDSIASSTGGDDEPLMRRQIRKILELHEVASALISEDKRDQFRRRHERTLSVRALVSHVMDQYESSIRYLSDPAVSGNIAPRLNRLSEAKRLSAVNTIPESEERVVTFYEPLIVALLDGLLNNAINAAGSSAPRVVVELMMGDTVAEVYLQVTNSTDISLERLRTLERTLNSPGPDKVGITELHWMSKACWPDVSDNQRLSWSVVDEPRGVVARALIAKVANDS